MYSLNQVVLNMVQDLDALNESNIDNPSLLLQKNGVKQLLSQITLDLAPEDVIRNKLSPVKTYIAMISEGNPFHLFEKEFLFTYDRTLTNLNLLLYGYKD